MPKKKPETSSHNTPDSRTKGPTPPRRIVFHRGQVPASSGEPARRPSPPIVRPSAQVWIQNLAQEIQPHKRQQVAFSQARNMSLVLPSPMGLLPWRRRPQPPLSSSPAWRRSQAPVRSEPCPCSKCSLQSPNGESPVAVMCSSDEWTNLSQRASNAQAWIH